MANMTLELNIYSAKDLENVNLITKMDVYAVVWINGDDSQKNYKKKTDVDRTGGSEPTWNHAVNFSVDRRLASEGRLTLVVKLVCDRIFGGKDLGEVHVPILELLKSSPSFNGDDSGNVQGMRFVTYQLRTPCGKGQGSLTFSYRFDTHSFKPDLPASPVYPNPIYTPPYFSSTTYYPPSQAGFYPPPPPSIGYPPSSQVQGYSGLPYPYPHQYDSHYPEQSGTAYPPLHSAVNYPPSSTTSNIYPPPHHPYLYPPPPDNPGQSYHPTSVPHPPSYGASPSQSFHGNPPPSPQTQEHGYGYPLTSLGYGTLGLRVGPGDLAGALGKLG